jgi:hypothetical protein
VLTYKILTLLTWILSIVVTVYYSVHEPHDGFTIRKRIWDQNYLYPTAFTQNSIITSIFWIVLFILQAGYIGHLFSSNSDVVHAAASVGSHFILNNLFHFGFVMLFVRSHFHWAELLLVLNFFNLTFLYFRHNTYPRFIHTPVVSAPLAWTFVAIYWNGAIMVPHPHSLVARIFGNIFIWAILAYGGFFIVVYKVSTKLARDISQRLTPVVIGLHDGILSQCSSCLYRSRPVLAPGHRAPVDLRLCHHGPPLRLYSHSRRARLDRKVQASPCC